MIRHGQQIVLLLVLLFAIIGCASGQKYAEVMSSASQMAPGTGRIFFYREAAYRGCADQPPIFLNGQKVGISIPGGFFYVDMPAGDYMVQIKGDGISSSSSFKVPEVNFSLQPGETKYVRATVVLAFGGWTGNIKPSLEDTQTAMKTLEKLSYTGGQ